MVVMMVIIQQGRGTDGGHTYDRRRGGDIGIMLLPCGIAHLKLRHLVTVVPLRDISGHVAIVERIHLRLIGRGAGTEERSGAQDSDGTKDLFHGGR